MGFNTIKATNFLHCCNIIFDQKPSYALSSHCIVHYLLIDVNTLHYLFITSLFFSLTL